MFDFWTKTAKFKKWGSVSYKKKTWLITEVFTEWSVSYELENSKDWSLEPMVLEEDLD